MENNDTPPRTPRVLRPAPEPEAQEAGTPPRMLGLLIVDVLAAKPALPARAAKRQAAPQGKRARE